MKAFWLSGILDRPSDRLYVRTISLFGCMDRRSYYILLHHYRSNLAHLSDFNSLVIGLMKFER